MYVLKLDFYHTANDTIELEFNLIPKWMRSFLHIKNVIFKDL